MRVLIFSLRLFFRLSNRADGKYTYSFGDGSEHIGSIWLRDKNQNNASYVDGTGESMYVEWDDFRPEKGLEAVSDFRAYLYRVDSYDMNSGQYVVNFRGGGPWAITADINAENATAQNLADMTEAIAQKDIYLENHYDKPRVQAIMTLKDNNSGSLSGSTLHFLYTDSIYFVGQNINGAKIWMKWDDEELLDNRSWKSFRNSVGKVAIDPSMAKADLRTLDRWFEDFDEIESITGLENLNTTNVLSTANMFRRCLKITTLNLNSWDTGKVTDMSGMFYGCSALKSLSISKLNTQNVTKMNSMFYGCSALTSLSLTDFNTDKVESMAWMFADCTGLTYLTLPFTTLKLGATNRMFYGCSNLKTINIKAMDGTSVGNTKEMFSGCKALANLYMNKFVPAVSRSSCENMFVDVPNTLKCTINHDLSDYIKEQIPGTKTEVYSEDYKAVYGSINNVDALIFINNTETYVSGTTYRMRINKRYYDVKVKGVWKGKSVLGSSTTSYPIWKTQANPYVKNVYIDESFTQSPSSLYGWFAGCSQVKKIQGIENLNTNRTTTMAYMFYGCENLEEVSVEKMNTAKITSMSYMFFGCKRLKEFTSWYSKFMMSNVTDASYMFYGCSALEEIIFPSQLSSSESDRTDKLTNTSYMFANCEQLKDIKRASYLGYDYVLTTNNVTNMEGMFDGCKSFAYLPYLVRNFSTSKVTTMRYMFRNCMAMTELSLVGYNTAKVTSMSQMFKGCSSLKSLNLSTFTSEKLNYASSMFQGVPTSCTIYVPFDISSKVLTECQNPPYVNRILVYPAYVIRYKVGGSTQLLFVGSKTTLKVGGKYNGYTIDQIWSGTEVMDSHDSNGHPWTIDLSNPVTKVTIEETFKNVPIVNASYYFSFYSKKLQSITGLQYLNLSNAKDLSWMFYGQSLLTSLDLSSWNTQNATDMSWMFTSCSNLASLTLGPNFRTDNVKKMNMMFSGCRSLKGLYLSKFNTSGVTEMVSMFSGCRSLTSLDLSKFDTHNVKDSWMASMFSGCRSLKSLDISNFDLSNQQSMLDMFGRCESLESLDLSGVDLSSVNDLSLAFDSCVSLRKLVIGSMFSPSNIKKGSYKVKVTAGTYNNGYSS